VKQSIIYKNISLYRFVITFLYGGKYKERFYKVCSFLKDDERKILELCFGDIIVADYCRDNHKDWTGIDVIEGFVVHAKQKGYLAQQADICQMDLLPVCDVCLMIGSLYHFADHLDKILPMMLTSSRRIIISEPINNLANRKDIIGTIASKMTAVNNKSVKFRYAKNTLLEQLDMLKNKMEFHYAILDEDRRDIILEIKK